MNLIHTPQVHHGLGRGYIPDTHAKREAALKFSARRPSHIARVRQTNMRQHVPAPLENQVNTERCVAFSGCTGLELRFALDGKPYVRLSRNGLYWPTRAINGWENEDGGALISSCGFAQNFVGIPSEAEWPSRLDNINVEPRGSAEVKGFRRADGPIELIEGYGADRVEAILDALQLGCPVQLDVNADYLRNTRDVIPAPPMNEGGRTNHAMLAVDFERGGEVIIFAGSYGTEFGDEGYTKHAAEWLAFTSDAVAYLPRGGVSHA